MYRPISQFDTDLIRGTLVDCSDGVRREFLGFDDDGDLILSDSHINGKNSEVVFFASDCSLKT